MPTIDSILSNAATLFLCIAIGYAIARATITLKIQHGRATDEPSKPVVLTEWQRTTFAAMITSLREAAKEAGEISDGYEAAITALANAKIEDVLASEDDAEEFAHAILSIGVDMNDEATGDEEDEELLSIAPVGLNDARVYAGALASSIRWGSEQA